MGHRKRRNWGQPKMARHNAKDDKAEQESVRETERRINEQNRKEADANKRLEKLLKDEDK